MATCQYLPHSAPGRCYLLLASVRFLNKGSSWVLLKVRTAGNNDHTERNYQKQVCRKCVPSAFHNPIFFWLISPLVCISNPKYLCLSCVWVGPFTSLQCSSGSLIPNGGVPVLTEWLINSLISYFVSSSLCAAALFLYCWILQFQSQTGVRLRCGGYKKRKNTCLAVGCLWNCQMKANSICKSTYLYWLLALPQEQFILM